jgi:hypothetical protein
VALEALILAQEVTEPQEAILLFHLLLLLAAGTAQEPARVVMEVRVAAAVQALAVAQAILHLQAHHKVVMVVAHRPELTITELAAAGQVVLVEMLLPKLAAPAVLA